MAKKCKYPNLAAEIARKCYTTKDVAEASGMCVSGIWKILKGKQKEISIGKAKRTRDELFPWMPIEYLFDLAESEGDGE